jgi:hypothetical protein
MGQRRESQKKNRHPGQANLEKPGDLTSVRKRLLRGEPAAEAAATFQGHHRWRSRGEAGEAAEVVRPSGEGFGRRKTHVFRYGFRVRSRA